MAVKSRGSILIIALWSICLLSTFAAILGLTVRQRLSLVYRLEEREGLRFVTEAGIKKAIFLLKKYATKPYFSLNDELANNPGLKSVGVGQGSFSIGYDYINEDTGQPAFNYGLIDEERKININTAELPVLQRLFQIVLQIDEVEAGNLAASIIDWRDEDNAQVSSYDSAESAYYETLSCPYTAKNNAFEALGELLLVKGMDEKIFAKIKDCVTIYGDGKVNLNTASREVLLSLGLSENIAGKIILFRQGKDRLPGTADDNIFQDVSLVTSQLNGAYHLRESEAEGLSQVADKYLGTNANNFMIRCIAKMNNRQKSKEAICVVERSGIILSWQE